MLSHQNGRKGGKLFLKWKKWRKGYDEVWGRRPRRRWWGVNRNIRVRCIANQCCNLTSTHGWQLRRQRFCIISFCAKLPLTSLATGAIWIFYLSSYVKNLLYIILVLVEVLFHSSGSFPSREEKGELRMVYTEYKERQSVPEGKFFSAEWRKERILMESRGKWLGERAREEVIELVLSLAQCRLSAAKPLEKCDVLWTLRWKNFQHFQWKVPFEVFCFH